MVNAALLHLDEVRCIAESDGSGHSEPYAWVLMFWVDDTTIGSGGIVGSIAPDSYPASRTVIKEGIKAGDAAPLPAIQRNFLHHFEPDQNLNYVGVVVVMLEEDETPFNAVEAGYRAFTREFPAALADFITTHLGPPKTDEDREEIENVVSARVRAAGENALSNWEKLQVALGTLNLDDEIGSASWNTEITNGASTTIDFTLTFVSGDETNHYEISARLELKEDPDPCEDDVNRVKRARAVVTELEEKIKSLQIRLQLAPPEEKATLLREIRRIRTEQLPGAIANLEVAQAMLAVCRFAERFPVSLG